MFIKKTNFLTFFWNYFYLAVLLLALSFGYTYNYTLFFFKNNYIFNYIIFFSGVVVVTPVFTLLNARLTGNTAPLYLYILFIPVVVLFVTTNNILIFFFCYEFFLLPSFLLVFFFSPNRRSLIASFYFLIWTQIGSFLVFIGVIFYIYHTSFYFFSIQGINIYISFLFFIGFGIKIPVWPFHYWLTKTHVEASTFFSIYLSGFLVKTALYGLWLFVFSHNHTISIFSFVAFLGVIDSSCKMWGQVDLKKLVAYATIQEMNLILLLLLLGSTYALKMCGFFIIAHTLLSSLFFYIVDVVYKRIGSRSIYSISGVLNTAPMLGYAIFIACILFAGIPFTLKFVVEVYLYTQLFNINSFFTVSLLIIANWVGVGCFIKHWFSLIFGGNYSLFSDLSKKEFFFFIANFILLFLVANLTSFLL